jgi:hypothetical protein
VLRSNTEFRRQEAQLEADMMRLQAERRDLELFFQQPETVRRREMAGFLNGLIAQRAFPWTKIFTDLEDNLPAGARVVTVEPVLVDDYVQLRLTVEALSDTAKLDLLRALEKSSEFSDIQLLGERRAETAAAGSPIVLSLVARYSVT